MRLSDKQREFWTEPYHRYYIKHGATRSGKTYLDFFMIPKRILERVGKPGLVVLIGNTRGTLMRNVLEPMTELYGPELVSPIHADNSVTLFGERAFCLGADSRRQADKLRGCSIKYCYGDELATWNEDVFRMLSSRMDKPYSVFDATCNPEGPDHWVKRFLDGGADVFSQSYTIDDNPFLERSVREAIKSEHTGVFYERLVMGRWVVAEGLVFPEYARAPEKWLVRAEDEAKSPFDRVTIGIDFGGNASKTWMVAVGFRNGFQNLVALDEATPPDTGRVDANDIAREYVRFYERVLERFGRVDETFGDSASPTLIHTLTAAAREADLPSRRVAPCAKNPVSQRPLTIDRLLASGRLAVSDACPNLSRALCGLRWDPERPDCPEDKNIGNINDVYDAFCYAWVTFGAYVDLGRTR